MNINKYGTSFGPFFIFILLRIKSLVEFMYFHKPVFTPMPGESYRRQLGSLLTRVFVVIA